MLKYKLGILGLILFVLLTKPNYAQNFQWLRVAGTSSSTEIANNIAVDSMGNSVFVGYFGNATISFGTSTILNNGATDFFIVKYDSSGNVLWATSGGGKYGEIAYKVCLDISGNVYVTGSYKDSCYFTPSFILRTKGISSTKAFVAKYSKDGVFKWAVSLGNDSLVGTSQGTAIGVDFVGNVFAAGRYSGNSAFCGTIGLYGGTDYLTKLDTNGYVVWAINISRLSVVDIDVDNLGNCFLTGTNNSSSSAFIGNITVTIFLGGSDIFLAKVSSNGVVIWVKNIGSSGTDNGVGISLSKGGYFYFTGKIGGATTIGNKPVTTYGTNTAVLACFDTSGICLWVKSGGITSGVGGTLTLVDVSSYSGDVAVFTGYIQTNIGQSVHINGRYFNSNGASDLIIIKMDSSGNFLYQFTSGGINNEIASSVALDKDNNVYVIGLYQSGISLKSLYASGFGGNDIFLTKISDIGISRAPLTKTVYCAGDSVYVSYTRYSSFTPGNTFSVQLSDSGGMFTNPAVIGSKQTTGSGIIGCRLPYGIPASALYQLRVVSDSPVVSSYYLNQPITINATPQANAGNDTLVCSGQQVQLQAQGGASYQWLPGYLVTDSVNASTIFKTPVNPNIIAQAFLVKLAATTAAGCSDTDTVVIMVKPKPVLHIPPDTTLCHGQSILLQATGSGGDSTAYAYSWSYTAGQTLSAKDTLSVVADTSKNILIKLTDACSQPGDSAVWHLQVLPSLKLSGATDTTVCEGGSVTYNLIASGGNGSASCHWSDGFTGNTRNIGVATSMLSYQITLADGCSDSITKTITITPELNPAVNLTATPDSGCIPLQVLLRNTTGNNSTTTYYWDKGDGNMQINTDTFMSVTYTTSGVYSPKLILKSQRGCTGAKTLANGVTVLPKPHAALSVNYDTTWITFSELTFTNQSTGADTFRWHFADGSTDTVVNTTGKIIHLFTDSGHFEVQLVAQNTFGCTDTARQKIVVLQDFDVWIPNAFTPGTDSINNTFYPVGVGIREYNIFIYNRWGQLVFESKGKLDRWNGCMQNDPNAPLPDGIYGYYIELRNYKGRGFMYKGSVTLLR